MIDWLLGAKSLCLMQRHSMCRRHWDERNNTSGGLLRAAPLRHNPARAAPGAQIWGSDPKCNWCMHATISKGGPEDIDYRLANSWIRVQFGHKNTQFNYDILRYLARVAKRLQLWWWLQYNCVHLWIDFSGWGFNHESLPSNPSSAVPVSWESNDHLQ